MKKGSRNHRMPEVGSDGSIVGCGRVPLAIDEAGQAHAKRNDTDCCSAVD
jgi:hypothetical protein